MAFLDKLKKLDISNQPMQVRSPLTSVTKQENLNSMQNISPQKKMLTTDPLEKKLNQIPERGQVGANFQGGKVKQRFLADLPANTQIQGINQILSGQNTNNEQLNNFVKTSSARGMTPEQIRLAFIENQKQSTDPLVLI